MRGICGAVSAIAAMAGTLIHSSYLPARSAGILPVGMPELSRAELREVERDAIDVISRFSGGLLAPEEVPDSLVRRAYQRLAGEEQTLEYGDVIKRFLNGPYLDVAISDGRKFANYVLPSHLDEYWRSLEQRQGRILEGVSFRLGLLVLEDALENPSKPLEDLVKGALDRMDMSGVRQDAWEEYDWKRRWQIDTERDDADARYGEITAFLLFHTEEALNTYAQFKGGRQEYELALDVRTAALYRMDTLLARARPFHGRILDLSQEHNVPPGQLAHAIASYWSYADGSFVSRSDERNGRSDLSVTLERLTLAAIVHLRHLHSRGIANVVVTDRGAHPYGLIIEEIAENLRLDVGVDYAKFVGKGVLAESYALTDEFLEEYSLAERARMAENAEIRNALKESRGTPLAGLLAQRLHERIMEDECLYDEVAGRAGQYQSRAIGLEHLAGKRIAAIDDWMHTGETAENIRMILGKMGVASLELNFLVSTKSSDGCGSLVVDPLSYEDVLGEEWRRSIPWKRVRELSGVSYGIDRGAKRAADLFFRRADVDAFSLQRPRDDFYSHMEMQEIAHDLAQSCLLTLQGNYVQETLPLVAGALRILQDYGVKDSYEGTGRRLNMLRNRVFRSHLRAVVRNSLNLLKERGTDPSGYVAGKKQSAFLDAYDHLQVSRRV